MSDKNIINDRLMMIGCGILRKEIQYLIKKNQWPIDTLFLDSSLHISFSKLETNLTKALNKHKEKNIIVFYGCCHPLMDKILDKKNILRIPGQNCLEMLLGNIFIKELSKGAFFLLEDWAVKWNQIITENFGSNQAIIRDIFKADRKYLLGIQTLCSKDFTSQAEEAGKFVGLPVYWINVTLDHLETILYQTIMKKLK